MFWDSRWSQMQMNAKGSIVSNEWQYFKHNVRVHNSLNYMQWGSLDAPDEVEWEIKSDASVSEYKITRNASIALL